MLRPSNSYLLLSALADFAYLVDLYSISDNCVREWSLWLCGKGIRFLSGQTGFESHDMRGFFSAMLHCFIPLLRHSFRRSKQRSARAEKAQNELVSSIVFRPQMIEHMIEDKYT